jgi:hypothetical protein
LSSSEGSWGYFLNFYRWCSGCYLWIFRRHCKKDKQCLPCLSAFGLSQSKAFDRWPYGQDCNWKWVCGMMYFPSMSRQGSNLTYSEGCFQGSGLWSNKVSQIFGRSIWAKCGQKVWAATILWRKYIVAHSQAMPMHVIIMKEQIML